MNNHNKLNRRGKRLARTTLVAGLAIGAAGGAAGMRAADSSAHANAVKKAAIEAQPWCEVPANVGGIDVSVENMGKDPSNATVKVIKSDGKVVDPFQDASMEFGQRIPETAIVAVDHVGQAACKAAGGISTAELTPDLQQPVQVDSVPNNK